VTAAEVLGCRVGRVLAEDGHGTWLPVLPLTDREMDALPEYSASIPTGKTLGKRWRRGVRQAAAASPRWVVGEYAALSPEDQVRWPDEIAILWYLPVVDGAAPGVWADRRQRLVQAAEAQVPA
jgi:hypothetical protein